MVRKTWIGKTSIRNTWICNTWIRTSWMAVLLTASMASLPAGVAQERRSRIDVEHYTIDAEVNPKNQTLTATVQVRFVPVDDNISSTSFELNNALNVSKVVDGNGRQVPASRSQQDFQIRLNFPEPLKKGQASTLTFSYDGRLTGNEESPVYGIKFAAIKSDTSYLLYPARWFPVNDYTTDRYTSDMKIVVPAGYSVIGSGLEEKDRAAGDKIAYGFKFIHPSFPGSIAVVQGEPTKVSAQGVTTNIYFREQREMANAYGQEVGKIMTYLTSVFGVPPQSSLAVIEVENGTPNGYSAPGILFLSAKAIGHTVNPRLLANQIARQWWGVKVSPTTRNHLWLQNGAARYAEFLYLEHENGAAALESEVRDAYIEALTVDNVPLIQAARLEDY